MGPIPFFVVPNLKKNIVKLYQISLLSLQDTFFKTKTQTLRLIFKKMNKKSPNKLTLLCHLPLICLIPGVNQKL